MVSHARFARRKSVAVLALLFGLLAAFVVGEVAARLLTDVDADGNVTVGSRRLRPFRPPARRIAAKVDELESAPGACVYHPELGWAPVPNGRSKDGMYVYNSGRVRTGEPVREFTAAPGADVHRIAMFGDSFTHSDDVAFELSWAASLETALGQDRKPEVLNLGFGGYGMDQAYLRWRIDGKGFAPHTVLFGFQAENVQRNLNLVRAFIYWKTGLPFSKPRFVLREGGLELINVPTVAPDDLPAVVASVDSWELRDHEYFYAAQDYRSRPWTRSRLLAAVTSVVLAPSRPVIDRRFYDPTGEPGRLALKIIEAFARDVEYTGAEFWIVHLPKRADLTRLEAGEELDYEALLDELQRSYRVIETSPAFLESAAATTLDDHFVSPSNGHYSATGNRVLADVVARELRAGGSRGSRGRVLISD